MQPNLSIDADPQQQETASLQLLVLRHLYVRRLR